ncbi:lactate racemase domain-containing protein [bacterium]|nr:lactate racemase domain-containing protein [bacterium]
MRAQLRFGARTGEIRIDDSRLSNHFRGPVADESISTEGLVRQAIELPLDAPRIHLACTPEDRIAIVLDADLPDAAVIVGPMIESLCGERGIPPEQISIVHTDAASRGNIDDLIESLPDEFADVQIIEHHPGDAQSVSYLASTSAGRRIYLSRSIIDADFFFVISECVFDGLTGRRGPSSTLYPAMSNAESLLYARRLAIDHRASLDLLHQRQDCEEIAYMSGLFYGVGVSRDAVGQVDHVWLGKFDSVQRAANLHLDHTWTINRAEESPDLVVAVCSPSPHAGSWSNIGAALESASRLLGPDGGKIVIVSDVAENPGPALQMISRDGATWETINALRESEEGDSMAAIQCAEAVNSMTVYLLSGMANDVVESLGMVPVASLHEIENLTRRAARIYLVENADRVHVNVPKVSIYGKQSSEQIEEEQSDWDDDDE